MKDISKFQAVLMILIFIISVWLVFWGRSKPGYFGLSMEVVGIIGLIAELYLYNKQYR